MKASKKLSGFGDLKKTVKKQNEIRKKEEEARRIAEEKSRSDREIFLAGIGDDVVPLNPDGRVSVKKPAPPPIPAQRIADEKRVLTESLSDDFSVETMLDTDEELSYARQGIGSDVLKKLRRGEWVIQSQLDLHGMRRDEAREAVASFLRRAAQRGIRCLRIVHGKGLGSVNNEPVLKGLVRRWLVQCAEVLAFCQAKPADGGGGAVVVLLKGQRPR